MKKTLIFLLLVLIGSATFAQLGAALTVKKADARYVKSAGSFQLKDSIYFKEEVYTKQQSEALKNNNQLLEAMTRIGTIMKAVPIGVSTVSAFNSTLALTDGACIYVMFDIPDTIVSTGVAFSLNVAGNFTADNYNGFSLNTVSGSTYTKVTETVTDGNLFKTTAYTLGKKAWPTPQTLLPGTYMITCHWNASATTTAPTIYTWGAVSTNFGLLFSATNKLCGYLTNQTTTPISTTGSALTASSSIPFIFPY